MLPKPHRLPSPLVRQVMRTGKRIATPQFQLIFSKNSLGVPRFAFIVGNNIDKRATARNRMKRLLRESVHHLLPHVASGWDGVFLVKAKLGDKKQTEVEPVVRGLLEQASLL